MHWVLIERFLGNGAMGPAFDQSTGQRCFFDDTRRMVRNAEGVEVLSSSSVVLPPGVATVPLGSRVTAPGSFGGRIASVIAVSVRDSGDLELPDHVVLSLE